jgi:cobalt-zinc-cadmium efflux system membrane fusion protein
VKYFEATIALSAADSVGLKPGQRVRARIAVDDRADVLTIPRGALVERGERRLVYRRESDAFRPVEVVTGRRSLGRIVIEKGLEAGDVIALHDPERHLASGGASGATGAPGGAR